MHACTHSQRTLASTRKARWTAAHATASETRYWNKEDDHDHDGGGGYGDDSDDDDDDDDDDGGEKDARRIDLPTWRLWCEM